jgi:AcrR family transcriptional regulator
VLRSAIKVFWSRGYEASSIADLTEALGIKRSSLYHEFGDKEGLFLEAIDLYIVEKIVPCLDCLEKGQALAEDLGDSFNSFIAVICNSETPRGCPVTSALADAAGSLPRARTKLTDSMTVLDGAFTQRLEKARLDGTLSTACDADVMAKLFVNVMLGLSVRARAGDLLETLQAIADCAVVRLLEPHR